MKTIGILSDTHGMLREEVLLRLQECDAILHAGDVDCEGILETLEEIAPVYVVQGNCDIYWAQHLPHFLDETIFGVHFYMTHRESDLPPFLSVYDLVVYGHSHRYEYSRDGETVVINPGSCGPLRFDRQATMALLYVSEDGKIQDVRKIDLLEERAAKAETFTADKGLKRDIRRVMKAVDKGKPVSEIAASLHINEGLTEQICRLYLTHPGVDADGIMTKMGL